MPEASPKGQAVESAYDLAGRVSQTRHYPDIASIIPEETRIFAYDLAGNVLVVEEWAGEADIGTLTRSTRYVYDDLYRVTDECAYGQGIDPYQNDDEGNPSGFDHKVTSEYDLAGNRVTVAYPGGRSLGSDYDVLNRLEKVRDGALETIYAYDKNGNRLSCAYPNGTVNRYSYDALNRVEATETVAGGTVVYAIGDVDDATGETATRGYEYDLVGNRINITETSQPAGDPAPAAVTRYLHYGYDARYQLTDEWWSEDPEDDTADEADLGASYAYEYDLAGNRTWMNHSGTVTTYTYNVRNEILTATGDSVTTYGYDGNGNRETKDVAAGDSTFYVYDTSDRLVSVDLNNEEVFRAAYDYRTRRVSKTEGADVTAFRYDGGVSFDEWRNGTKQVEFVRGSGLGGGIGSILYSDRPAGGREYFVYSPAVGHVTATLLEDASVKSSAPTGPTRTTSRGTGRSSGRTACPRRRAGGRPRGAGSGTA